jgi:putative transposase
MPRIARLVVPDVSIHIIQRGNNRSACFVGVRDYRAYLRYLRVYAARFGCAVHAYCLMTNHVHLLLTPETPRSCAQLMQRLGQCYVQTFNMAHGRSGTLWEGRFHSCLVPTEDYVLACHRYIELNPVRAGMVSAPEHYPWSSFAANAAPSGDSFITRHAALEVLGSAYRTLFDAPSDNRVLEEIRKATRSGQRLGLPPKRRGRPPKTETGSVPILSLPGRTIGA